MGEPSYSIGETIVAILQTALALMCSVFFIAESIIVALIPRSFKRHSVEGQIVLITGGGSGLGRLAAIKLANKGAKIVTWDVNTQGNEETVKQVRASGGECYAYTVDLCDRHAIYKAAELVKREVGKVDILLNNAGIVTGKNFRDCSDDMIQKTFDVNVMSHFWTTKAFLPEMIKSERGHVVTIASLAGLVGVNKLADYCASKFAAVGFDESLRVEVDVEGYKGVHTTVICPYYISTGMFSGVKSKVLPILEPDYVAGEIVDGILMRKRQVVIPGIANFVVALKALLPYKALLMIGQTMGTTTSMDEFKGRKKTQ